MTKKELAVIKRAVLAELRSIGRLWMDADLGRKGEREARRLFAIAAAAVQKARGRK